jgi:hypothetical protein
MHPHPHLYRAYAQARIDELHSTALRHRTASEIAGPADQRLRGYLANGRRDRPVAADNRNINTPTKWWRRAT